MTAPTEAAQLRTLTDIQERVDNALLDSLTDRIDADNLAQDEADGFADILHGWKLWRMLGRPSGMLNDLLAVAASPDDLVRDAVDEVATRYACQVYTARTSGGVL